MKPKSVLVLAAALAALVVPSTSAHADTFLTPFVGVAFGGDTEESEMTYGGSVLFMGRGAGLELEVGHTPEFFGSGDTAVSVTTVMVNYVAGGDLRGAGTKPYALVGVGLMRTNVEGLGDLVDPENKVALNLGVGVVSLFNSTVGVRGEVRYFRRLQGASDTPLIPVADNFDFWRGAVGVTLRF